MIGNVVEGVLFWSDFNWNIYTSSQDVEFGSTTTKVLSASIPGLTAGQIRSLSTNLPTWFPQGTTKRALDLVSGTRNMEYMQSDSWIDFLLFPWISAIMLPRYMRVIKIPPPRDNATQHHVILHFSHSHSFSIPAHHRTAWRHDKCQAIHSFSSSVIIIHPKSAGGLQRNPNSIPGLVGDLTYGALASAGRALARSTAAATVVTYERCWSVQMDQKKQALSRYSLTWTMMMTPPC